MTDVIKNSSLVGMDGKALKSLNTGQDYDPTPNFRIKSRVYQMLRRKHNSMILSGKFDPNMFVKDFSPIWKERLRNYELYTGEEVEIMHRQERIDRSDLSGINNKIKLPYFKLIVDQGVQMINSNQTDFAYNNSEEVEDDMLEYQNELLKSEGDFEIENINEEPIELIEFRNLMKDMKFQPHLVQASTMQDATGTAFWKVIPTNVTYDGRNEDGHDSFTELEITEIDSWFGERLKDAAITIEDQWTETGMLFYILTVWTESKVYKYVTPPIDVLLNDTSDVLLGLTFAQSTTEDSSGEKVEGSHVTTNTLGLIPIVEFRANENRVSVFEQVEDIIHSVNLTISDQQNEIEQFRLAYLFMHGEGMTREVAESIMKKGGIIHANTPTANVKYLVKELKVDFNKFHLETMVNRIFTLSNTIDFGGEGFSGSGSNGESRQWQIKPLEDRTKIKEIFIQDALGNFSEIVETFMKMETSDYEEPIDSSKVIYTFKRSVPVDIVYLADAISKVKGVVSNYTLSGMLPMVDNKTREQMLLRIEKAEDMQAQMSAIKMESENTPQQPLKVGGTNGTGGTTPKNIKPDSGGTTTGGGSAPKAPKVT